MDITLLPTSGVFQEAALEFWEHKGVGLLRWLQDHLGYKGKIGVERKHGRASIHFSLGEMSSLGLSYTVASLGFNGLNW